MENRLRFEGDLEQVLAVCFFKTIAIFCLLEALLSAGPFPAQPFPSSGPPARSRPLARAFPSARAAAPTHAGLPCLDAPFDNLRTRRGTLSRSWRVWAINFFYRVFEGAHNLLFSSQSLTQESMLQLGCVQHFWQKAGHILKSGSADRPTRTASAPKPAAPEIISLACPTLYAELDLFCAS